MQAHVFGPLLHIFARCLKACNGFFFFFTLSTCPAAIAAAWQLCASVASIFLLLCSQFVVVVVVFLVPFVAPCWVFLSSYFPVILLELDSINHERERAVPSPHSTHPPPACCNCYTGTGTAIAAVILYGNFHHRSRKLMARAGFKLLHCATLCPLCGTYDDATCCMLHWLRLLQLIRSNDSSRKSKHPVPRMDAHTHMHICICHVCVWHNHI